MQVADQPHGLFVCHECDALQNVSGIKPGNVASCVCCGSTLFRNPKSGVERPLALTLASMMLFLVANIYPIMTINIAGIERAATLTDSAMIFVELGSPELAATVWIPSVFIPGFIIFGLLYVLLSIRFALGWPFTKPILIWVSRFLPFGMMDVFLLGVLVALVKLVALADVLLGPGFYAFIAVIFTYAAATASLEPHVLWELLDKQPDEQREVYHG
jgi:paraquat-inducible protein A